MRIDDIQRCLMQEQRDVADAAMTNPTGKTLYDYGYGVGFYLGIGAAWQVLEKMYRDEESRDQDM